MNKEEDDFDLTKEEDNNDNFLLSFAKNLKD